MVRPASTTITCPACQRPFNAILEQIIDVGRDPTAKERLLSGRINLITCPHCGYQGVVATPLLYHDPSKPLVIVYVPMELGLQKAEQEKIIGDMTNAIMRSLPEDAPKGYLLQPKTALTLQGLIDQVLEADGITKEMLEAERRKVELVNELAEADAERREQLLAENQDLFDIGFLELLTAAAQAASQAGESRKALRLLNVRKHLMETTEVGQALQAQQEALIEASRELEALGKEISRESFVDLLVRAADNPSKVDALATLGQPLLDYVTFQLITDRVNNAQTDEERERLAAMRERVLAINEEFERQQRALIQRAVDTLRMLLQAHDVREAIRSNLDRIDDMFLQVLLANLEEARRSGNVEAANRLREIRDEVLNLIQESAPPEIRLINELLSIESEDESLEALRNRRSEINEQVVHLMGDLAVQLREAGNEEAARRLELLRVEAERMTS
ncbi:MAG TPA: hypothetical protein ENI95_14120 [Chloroflexi bacterium]|nr:hypothetical protein [Chloroflexota bacterium]